MSDSSGFTQISAPQGTANAGNNRGGQLAQIINLPVNLESNPRAIRLKGQVTQQNSNGSVRIATAEGEVDVQIRGNRSPQVGQRLEIEVPAGRPPRQVTLRDAPETTNRTDNAANNARLTSQNTQVEARITTAQNTAGQQATTRPTPAPSQPLPPAIQEALTQQNGNTSVPPRTLTTESAVRLLPVPPAQAQSIATAFFQALPAPQNVTLARAAFTANLIAQNAVNQTATPLLQTSNNISQNTPLSPTQFLTPQVQNVSQSILTNSFFQTPVSQSVSLIQPTLSPQAAQTPVQITTALNTAFITSEQALAPQNVTNLLQTQNVSSTANNAQTPIQQPQNATLIPTPVAFDPANPALPSQARSTPIDIQILRITPPQVQVTAPLLPNTQTAPLPAATNFIPPIIGVNNAATLTAQVTGFTQQGLPLVTIQGLGTRLPQSFVLQLNTNNLQLGTQLQIIPTATTAAQTLPRFNAANPLMSGFQWQAVDDLFNTLLQNNPQAAASLTRSLPNIGNPAQTSAAAMVFIAAVKSGNLNLLLGHQKIEMLQRAGNDSILRGLTQDSAAAARTAEAAPASEWRAVPLPMFWDNEIHRITLYTRREEQEQNQQQDGNGQTRFVFDLSLSRMGDVQLDGLLRDKRLDLIIRTQDAFSPPMQQTMRQSYTNALSHADLTGELDFQGSTRNWVHILEEKEQLGVHV